jgi:hypothetical protein
MTGRSLRQFDHRGRQKRPQRIAPALAQLAILPPSCTHSAACAHAQVAHAGHSPPVLVCKIWRCLPSATAPPSQAQHSERGKLTKDMAGISVRCTSFGPGRSTSILRITCTGRVVNAHTGGACQRGVTETLFIALRAHNKKIPFLGIRIQLRDEQAQGCCGLG